MISTITRLNHLALVVEDLEAALAFWRDDLGLPLTHIEEIPSQQSVVAFLPTGDSEIELVKPTAGDSGLAKFLQQRGPGIHHICLEVDDLEGMLAHLKARGVHLINETPTTGAGGSRMAFIHPSSAFGVLVELYQSKK